MPVGTRDVDAGMDNLRGRGRGVATRLPIPGCARTWRGGQHGFTIIELLVAMLITTVIVGAILAVFASTSGVFNSQQVRVLNQDSARTAINQMARYLRMACSSADNMTTQSNAIATAESDDIEFYCDLDGNGIPEKVRYYLSDYNLMMQTAVATTATTAPFYAYPDYETDGVVVGEAIRNDTEPVFTYYRYNGSSGALEAFTPMDAAGRQEIVSVAISLIVNEKPELANGNVELATNVQLRQRYEGGLSEE